MDSDSGEEGCIGDVEDDDGGGGGSLDDEGSGR